MMRPGRCHLPKNVEQHVGRTKILNSPHCEIFWGVSVKRRKHITKHLVVGSVMCTFHDAGYRRITTPDEEKFCCFKKNIWNNVCSFVE